MEDHTSFVEKELESKSIFEHFPLSSLKTEYTIHLGTNIYVTMYMTYIWYYFNP